MVTTRYRPADNPSIILRTSTKDRFPVMKFPVVFIVLILSSFNGAFAATRSGFSSLEFSPVRAVVNLESDGHKSYTGGVIFDGRDSRTEFAIPVTYVTDKYNDGCCDASLTKIDFQWRRYRRDQRTGPYGGLFARAMHVSGGRDDVSASRLGVGLVGGFRVFLTQHVYWGANVSVGRYLSELPDESDDGFLSFNEFSVDLADKALFNVEFLKIGYRF